jgi:hypothetical protein
LRIMRRRGEVLRVVEKLGGNGEAFGGGFGEEGDAIFFIRL